MAGMMKRGICEKVILSDLRLGGGEGVMRGHAALITSVMTHVNVLTAMILQVNI